MDASEDMVIVVVGNALFSMAAPCIPDCRCMHAVLAVGSAATMLCLRNAGLQVAVHLLAKDLFGFYSFLGWVDGDFAYVAHV